jgi:hypothetical protein
VACRTGAVVETVNSTSLPTTLDRTAVLHERFDAGVGRWMDRRARGDDLRRMHGAHDDESITLVVVAAVGVEFPRTGQTPEDMAEAIARSRSHQHLARLAGAAAVAAVAHEEHLLRHTALRQHGHVQVGAGGQRQQRLVGEVFALQVRSRGRQLDDQRRLARVIAAAKPNGAARGWAVWCECCANTSVASSRARDHCDVGRVRRASAAAVARPQPSRRKQLPIWRGIDCAAARRRPRAAARRNEPLVQLRELAFEPHRSRLLIARVSG